MARCGLPRADTQVRRARVPLGGHWCPKSPIHPLFSSNLSDTVPFGRDLGAYLAMVERVPSPKWRTAAWPDHGRPRRYLCCRPRAADRCRRVGGRRRARCRCRCRTYPTSAALPTTMDLQQQYQGQASVTHCETRHHQVVGTASRHVRPGDHVQHSRVQGTTPLRTHRGSRARLDE